MRAIQPVHLDDTGDAVSNLHKGLLFLIFQQAGISDNDRSILAQRLAPEVRSHKFGNATLDLVMIWQEQLKKRSNIPQKVRNDIIKYVTVNGDVDEATAKALNWLLTEVGAL